MTYIDHNTKSVFKGSALGKEFSASILDRTFGTGALSADLYSDYRPSFEKQTRGKDFIGGILDVFTPGDGSIADDYQAEAEAKRALRKKKKKRKGLHL